jgi:hypothetical protein
MQNYISKDSFFTATKLHGVKLRNYEPNHTNVDHRITTAMGRGTTKKVKAEEGNQRSSPQGV